MELFRRDPFFWLTILNSYRLQLSVSLGECILQLANSNSYFLEKMFSREAGVCLKI